MDAQTCLKKLQCVRVLNFSTVGLDGTPQARCISAIHYTSDALYFSLRAEKNFAVNFFTTDKYRYWRIPGIKR